MNRFSSPGTPAAPRLQAGPVAEGDEDARGRVATVQGLVEQLKAALEKASAIIQKLIDMAKNSEDEPV